MHHSKVLYEEGILKNKNMITQSQYSEYQFSGRLTNVKAFYAGMKGICFGDTAKFIINENGFRVLTENANSIQASLFITKEMFEGFCLSYEAQFSISMNVLIDIINVFAGTDCSLQILYKGEAAPLMFIVEYKEEPDVSTECSLKTSHCEEYTEYSLNEDGSSYNALFVRGPELSQIFSEIDKTAEELAITLSPKEPYFRIATIGVMQSESNIEVAKTSEMILLFNCRETTVARYKCSHVRLTAKALSTTTKAAIKTDSSGLMELQFMIFSNNEAQVYIQFFILPLVDED